jgi:RNA polymerase sigma-70 factor (ECF subfamily)
MEYCVAMTESQSHDGIIELCRQGDREAYRRLFEMYKDTVYSIALHFLHGDTATAEDISQEVFVRLFTRIGQYRHEADFKTWLYRLVANACIDEQRRRKRFVACDDIESAQDMAVQNKNEDPFERMEMIEAVKGAMAGLNPKLRMTVLLKYFEDLSYEEMSEALGCSKGTIASRLNRSHKILARKLSYLSNTRGAGE